jgi:PAS domain S-box-containing protein
MVTVLIANMESSSALELKGLLGQLGYQVIAVTSTREEAVHRAKELKPNVVLMKMQFKGRNDISRTGRLIQDLGDSPVVYVVDTAGQDTIRRAGTTGSFGYIFKPYDKSQILAVIETALIRHQLEKKLQEGQQWLIAILTSVADGVVSTDENGLIRFMNPAAARLTGWQEKEAIARPFYEVFTLFDERSNELVNFVDFYAQSAKEDAEKDFVGILHPRDGKPVLVEAKATPIQGADNEVRGVVFAFRDVSQQRAAMLEIQHQAQRAETLLQVASQVNTDFELETVLKKICEAVTGALKSFGTSVFIRDAKRNVFRSMAVTSNIPLLENPSSIQFAIPFDAFQTLVNPENPVVLIMDARSYPNMKSIEMFKDLGIQTIILAPLFRRGSVIGAVMLFFREKLDFLPEDELKLIKGLADQAGVAIANASFFEQVRASRERQQFISSQLVKVQEDERRSLARELHDEVGQMLTGLQFTVKSLMTNSDEEQRNKLDEAQIIISAIISQIRELSINLRPSLLDDLGILPTLEWYFDRYEAKTGIQVKFQQQNLDKRFYAELETTAFRIVQEALTNVARYAETNVVDVRIIVLESIMQIEVIDQGRGFDTSGLVKGQSLGLEGMRERAYAIGGMLEIQSGMGLGTRIRASLPVSGQIERRTYERDHSLGR